MVIPEAKRQLLLDIIALQSQPDGELETQNKLHEMLIQDTGNGKLYKYREFDKEGYAVQSLCTGTLHCSNAAIFNDPFDCEIGVTIASLMEAILKKEFTLLLDVFETFESIIHQNETIEDVEDSNVKYLVLKLLNNNDIMDIVSKHKSSLSDQTNGSHAYKIKRFITSLTRMLCEDKIASKMFPSFRHMYLPLIESLTPERLVELSKENTTFRDFARANEVPEDQDEIGLLLGLNKKVNPENEFDNEKAENVLTTICAKINANIREKFLVGCLCTDFKNRLMWSHYANNHKGFCIEYDFSQAKTALPYPVYYSKDRPLVPWEAILNQSSENMKAAIPKLLLALFTKDNVWSYENEWRFLIQASEDTEIKMPPITCLYLGAAITKSDRINIINIANKFNIPVKQIKLDRGTYDLHTETLSL